MLRYLGLLILGLVVGCSSTKKKEEPAKAPAKTESAAAAPAAAPSVKEDAKTSRNETTKKTKKESVATAKTVSAEGDVTCTSGSDERKLAIKAKGEGCELEYTKAGQMNAIASQIVGNAKCEEVSTRIKDKLVAAGYTCN